MTFPPSSFFSSPLEIHAGQILLLPPNLLRFRI